MNCLFSLADEPGLGVLIRDQRPNDPGGEDHRLGFAHRGVFLGHDQKVGKNEYCERENPAPVRCQVEWIRRSIPFGSRDRAARHYFADHTGRYPVWSG